MPALSYPDWLQDRHGLYPYSRDRARAQSLKCPPRIAVNASPSNVAYVFSDIGVTMSPAGLSRVKLFSPRIIAVPIKNSIALSILTLNLWNLILNNRKLTC